MEELLRASLPFVGPVLAPIFVVLLAPLLHRCGRTVMAGLMALVAVGLIADVLVFDHSELYELEVPSVFGRGEGDAVQMFVWVTDLVEAPAWQWHLVAACYFAVAGLWAFVGRARPPRVPAPVVTAVLVFAFALLVRLLLEKTAAHVGIVWALGTSAAGFVISLFFGYYAGRRGVSVARFFGAFALANLLQRALLVAVGYVLTTQHLGTHLDVTAITDITPPGIGPIQIESPTHGWMVCLLVPQMTFALVMATITGFVLGLLPFVFGRRRAARDRDSRE